MAVFQIRSAVKNYEWGKYGLNSAVATLYKSVFSDFEVNDTTPYSELWMGTHPSGPATIPSQENKQLLDWINANPESLGNNIINTFGKSNGLPFLFKVLSVNKALSIQAHPDKKTAEKLYKEFSDRYPDDNHKPEMAIALTEFEALCGFRPLSEIRAFLQELPQLKAVIGDEIAEAFIKDYNQEQLKTVFTALMSCDKDVFQPQLSQLSECFKSNKLGSELSKSMRDLFLRICSQYPGDIGCFCLFFLNYLKLKTGEAIFLAANEPHAYLNGDCIECMACSDNVVRAGLTPKFKDVQTLCDILTYNCKDGKDNIFPCVEDPHDSCVKTYNPPVREFALDQINILKQEKAYTLKAIDSASLLLVACGEGTYTIPDKPEEILALGTVLFISSGSQIQLKSSSKLLMFRAYCKT